MKMNWKLEAAAAAAAEVAPMRQRLQCRLVTL